MSAIDVKIALREFSKDEALTRHMLLVWPVVESILAAFSGATELPIFVFLNGQLVFRSSLETMPGFCKAMLDSPETERLCEADGVRRAKNEEPEIAKGVQLCHAGMVNGRREIETGVGPMIVLFGSKKSESVAAVARRTNIVEIARRIDLSLASTLETAGNETHTSDFIDERDVALMDAISEILARLFSATVGFRSLTINMAHELSLMMLAMGLLTDDIYSDGQKPQSLLLGDRVNEKPSSAALFYAQCRLGLYIIRNFLSHASETRYSEVIKPRFKTVNLKQIIEEMIELHQVLAARRGIVINSHGLGDLPDFVGSDMEIRRLFHNILNNAIKYSYHSTPEAQRSIRMRSKVPYDPGFKQERFSILVENYGLGLDDFEKKKVFEAGFRGKQAVAEVPIGAGIGLSEALKIAKAHYGDIKLHSRKLFEGDDQTTYLTGIEIIFPYAREYRRMARQKELA